MVFLNKLLKGAGIVFLGTAFGRLMAYFYILLLANKLGSSGYGLLSLGFVIVEFLVVISLVGFYDGLVRYISFYNERKSNAKIKGAIVSSLKICIPVSLIFAVLLFIFSKQISVYLFHTTELIPILKIFPFAIPFLVLSTLFFGIMRGFQKIDYEIFAKEGISKTAKLLFAFVIIFFFTLDLKYIVYSYLFSVLALFIVSLVIVHDLVKKLWKVKAKEYKKELFVFSFPLMLVGLMVILLGWTDIFMLGIFKTASDVGVYNVAMPISRLILVIPVAIVALFVPMISALYSKKDKKSIKSVFVNATKWNFLLNVPVFLSILIFSKEILSLMFKSEYGVGLYVILILSIGLFINSISYSCSGVLLAIKRTKEIFFAILIFSVINVILNYILIPKYGIIGAGIATSIAFGFGGVLNIGFCYKFSKMHPFKFGYIFKSLVSGIIVYGLFFVLKSAVNMGNIFLLIFWLIICGLIYLLVLYLLKTFNREDKDFFKALKRKISF